MPTRALLFTLLITAPLAARADDLMVLLEQRKCPQCRLADVDLVHADLRDTDLRNAKLMRANLSQAQCCELRQLTKSRQWHTTLPTALMLSTMSRLNHSLSETFKGATSSS